jgi:hypothetical protein
VPGEHQDLVADARDPDLVRAEADIDQARRQVAASIGELQREIARTIDWREWVRRKPRLAFGLAAGAGFLLGRRH